MAHRKRNLAALFLALGILLVLVGALFHITEVPFAQTAFFTGIISELVGALLLARNLMLS